MQRVSVSSTKDGTLHYCRDLSPKDKFVMCLGRGHGIVTETDVSECQLLLSDRPVLSLPDVCTDIVCPGCYKVNKLSQSHSLHVFAHVFLDSQTWHRCQLCPMSGIRM